VNCSVKSVPIIAIKQIDFHFFSSAAPLQLQVLAMAKVPVIARRGNEQ